MSWRRGHPFFGGDEKEEEEASLSPSSSRSDHLTNDSSTARSRKFSHRMRYLRKNRSNANNNKSKPPIHDASITDEAYDPSSMSMGSSSSATSPSNSNSNSNSSSNIGESYSSDAFSPRSLLASGTTSGDDDDDDDEVTESLYTMSASASGTFETTDGSYDADSNTLLTHSRSQTDESLSLSGPSTGVSSPRNKIFTRTTLTTSNDKHSPRRRTRAILQQLESHSSKEDEHHDTQRSPHKLPRVPGGAAAKLMLIGPQKPSEEDTTTISVPNTASGESQTVFFDHTAELDGQYQKTKAEFETGNQHNRRYQQQQHQQAAPPSPATPHHRNTASVNVTPIASNTMVERPTPVIVEDDEQEAEQPDNNTNTPSFLNRHQIFHDTPTSAILALISPRETHDELKSVISGHDDAVSQYFSAGQQPSPSTHEKTTKPTLSLPPLSHHPDTPSPLLSVKAEQRVAKIPSQMKPPNARLRELLTAIASTDQPPHDLLGYTVRRKNACGALHLLTTQDSNKIPIAWTAGVLPALVSVLRDAPTATTQRVATEYTAARNRAIAALLNLSMPVKNRLAVFHTPHLVQSCLEIACVDQPVLLQDGGVARRGVCGILAFLAKSPENRLLLAQVPGFMDAVRVVLVPKAPRVVAPTTKKVKKMYPWSSGDSDDEDDSDDENEEDDTLGDTVGNNTASTHHDKSYEESFGKTDTSGYTEDEDGAKEEEDEDKTDPEDDTRFVEGETPRVGGGRAPTELSGYDGTASKLLREARQNMFAVLLHLVKEKDNAYHLAREGAFVDIMVDVSKHRESQCHVLSVKLLANLTRHRLNTKPLVFQKGTVVPALVVATESEDGEARRYACHGIQNLAQDKSCRQELATTSGLIVALCKRARQADAAEERLAAVSALKNLCDEPANLIPMTNSPECISTLMHVAHGKEEGVTEMMQYRACDALATLSHWLRKIATSGQALEQAASPKSAAGESQGLCVPSLRVVSWNQWE